MDADLSSFASWNITSDEVDDIFELNENETQEKIINKQQFSANNESKIPSSVKIWQPFCEETIHLHHCDSILMKKRASKQKYITEFEIAFEMADLMGGFRSNLVLNDYPDIGHLKKNANYSVFYLKLREAIEIYQIVQDLSIFIGTKQFPRTICAFQVGLSDILQDYIVKTSLCTKDRSLSILRLELAMKNQLKRIKLLHTLCSPLIAVDSMDYFTIHDFLDKLAYYLDITDSTARSQPQIWQLLLFALRPIIQFIDDLLRIGRIDDQFGEFFIDQKGAIRPIRCRLFSSNLLNSLIEGMEMALEKSEDGAIPHFKDEFDAIIEASAAIDSQCRNRNSTRIRDSFDLAVQLCVQKHSRLQMDTVGKDQQLTIVIIEMATIYSLVSVRDFCRDLSSSYCHFRAEESFSQSLRMNGIENERISKWMILVSDDSHGYFVQPNLDWPLNSIIDRKLVGTLNGVFSFLLRLNLVRYSLVALRLHYGPPCTDSALSRKAYILLMEFILLVNTNLGIYSLKVRRLVEQNCQRITTTKSLNSAREYATILNDQLMKIVGINMQIAAEQLCELNTRLAVIWTEATLNPMIFVSINADFCNNRNLLMGNQISQ